MGVPRFRPLDATLAAGFICEVCHGAFPSAAAMQQHLISCIDPKRQLRVRLPCLTREQLLAHKVPQKQSNDVIKKFPTCKLQFNDSNPLILHKLESTISLERNEMSKDIVAGEDEDVPPIEKRPSSNKKKKKVSLESLTCDLPGCCFSSSSITRVEMHKLSDHNPTNIIECFLCGKVFNNISNVAMHMRKHETRRNRMFKCLHLGCYQTFSVEDFKMHYGQHQIQHKCEYCGLLLQTESVLKTHAIKHFAVTPELINCVHGVCQALYGKSADLKKHMAKHKINRPQFSCSKCRKCFPSGAKLKEHTRMNCKCISVDESIDAAATELSCPYCGVKLATVRYYNDHVNRHEKDAPGVFKCYRKGCSFQSTSVWHLEEHSNSQHEQQKFTCNECGKFYSTSVILRNHKLTHLKNRPYHCEVAGCWFAGKTNDDYRRHTKLVHENPGFNCHICGKHFQSHQSLQLHLEKHETGTTPLNFYCTHKNCRNLLFISSATLEKHKLSHSEKVALNVPGFDQSIDSLSEHKADACDFCGAICRCDKSASLKTTNQPGPLSIIGLSSPDEILKIEEFDID